MSLLIKGGLIVTSTGRYTADVYVENGKIKNIGTGLDVQADEVVDAAGRYVLPGAIDPHTHLSMPFMGTHAQDDYETGTIAAACGGVTTVVDFDLQQKGESLLEAIERKKVMGRWQGGGGLFPAPGGDGPPAGGDRRGETGVSGVRDTELQDFHGL